MAKTRAPSTHGESCVGAPTGVRKLTHRLALQIHPTAGLGQGRPIVWPSAALQRDELGLSPAQVKAINRALIDAGLITMKDSPNGKRYGKRDSHKRIVEAYGFDLSPLAVRRAEMGRLRRRATIARNCIIQIVEAAAESGFVDETWARLVREARNVR